MGQKKLIRFEAIKSFPNVLQYPENMAGNWKNLFHNNNELTLELACGKGEYTVELARRYPGKNFIGIDLKGNRLYIGAKKCLEEKISNAAFLRTQIIKINNYFKSSEVAEIWLTFPDPQLRNSKADKRLTHPRFLRLYQQIMVPGGSVHLKTDSPELYAFTKLVIELYHLELHEDYEDLYAWPGITADMQIKTHYESLDIAGSSLIHYLRFTLPAITLPFKDEILQERLASHGETTH